MFVEVALEAGNFIYKVSKKFVNMVRIGSFVKVPLGKNVTNGFVVQFVPKPEYNKKIKNVISVYSEPTLPDNLLSLGYWLSSYYHSTLGQALEMMCPLPQKIKLKSVETKKVSFGETSLPLNIKRAIEEGKPASFVIHGQDRSKIYINAIIETLKRGKSVIYLVPEINFIPPTIKTLPSELLNFLSIYHSKLSSTARFNEWLKIKNEVSKIIIGPISAIFAPIKAGLIIIDDEGNQSYKSEKHPRYNAITVANKRKEIDNCVVILGSDAPTISSLYKSEVIKLTGFTPAKKITIVNMRKETNKIFSYLLMNRLEYYIKKDEKILLFLNRRGYAPFILCEDCGYIPTCTNCGVALTYHKYKLICHYCNYKTEPHTYCPSCRGVNFSYKGVGTAMVEEYFKKNFQKVPIAKVDIDSVSKKFVPHIFNQYFSGEIKVILGTQMLNKHIYLPEIGLSAFICIDNGLNLPNFLSTENTFALLYRIISKSKEVIIQTYNPSHYIFSYILAHDYYGFYKEEINKRKEFNYPPFSTLVRVIISGKKESQVIEKAKEVKKFFKEQKLNVLGPSNCPIYKIRNKFRMQLLIKTNEVEKLILPKNVEIDIEPIEFM